MIPKRIIYCWLGGKEKPPLIKECMSTWKEHLKDYEFIEINESNFDININEYVKEAYKQEKWAFVSDVARLWGLYTYGGIYLDTDVKVYKNLDEFLKYDLFTGFEQPNYPVTAVMGTIKNNRIIKEMLDYYNDKIFEEKENWLDYKTNTMIMSDILSKYIDRQNYGYQYQPVDNIAIYPKGTFCRKEDNIEQYTEHLMLGSWIK